MAKTQGRDLAQFIGKRFDVEAPQSFELRMRRTARAHEVCVVRIRKPVRVGADCGEHRALFQN